MLDVVWMLWGEVTYKSTLGVKGLKSHDEKKQFNPLTPGSNL